MKPVIIPISNEKELKAYRKGILNILGRIEVKKCDEDFKEDLKIMYRLLNYFSINDDAMKNGHTNGRNIRQSENE